MSKEEIIKHLADNEIYAYGTEKLIKFEKNMERYFMREYLRWKDNPKKPEDYGVNSFEGEIAKAVTRDISIDHYNNEYQAYLAFLDKDYMAYTMAYYKSTDDNPSIADITLEQAQNNKYQLIAERAGIKDGQHVIDLGCGFGGLSKYLLATYPNITVTGINPSEVQTNHIRNVLINQDNDFDNNRFTLYQAYFDDIGPAEVGDNTIDRVISLGLLEHVTNLDLLFESISRVLKNNGKCLHHCIVSKDVIPQYLDSSNTMMAEYYPGAHIWPFKEPSRHNRHLTFIDSWFVNGLNYWKTLDEWHKRFWYSIDELYPAYLSLEQVEEWNRYFSLCKAMFCPDQGIWYGNGQYLYEAKQ